MANKIIKVTNKLIENESLLLNSEICSKLNQSRQKALLHASTEKSHFLFSWIMPATTMIVLVLYFTLPYIQSNTEPVNEYNLVMIEEMEILVQYELIENLEFYEWLSLDEESSI
ncbi:MAG: hypothetical protein JKX98_09420 [Alcanivoracaceae bacterium]|nr:hypothetical protein [Alcanivoracaceae bacterium]